MNLNEYQKLAITTKIYDDSVAIPYVVLGIVGEAAELYEKVTEKLNGEDVSLDLLGKECADIIWYLAAWADENDLMLKDLIIENLTYEHVMVDLKRDLESVIIFSGQIAEYAKKALRDDFSDISKGVYPASKMAKTNEAVANLYRATSFVAGSFGLNMEELLINNVEKLASRAERGVLGGSGDKR
tara:strand:+ start:78 stop:632 length:555 start_codon:yes stop_codon:yes gene_type:complete